MITRADSNNQVEPPSLAHRGPDDDLHITPSRLARYWGVHINTIYRDIRKGALRAYKMPGGQLRIRISDARRYGRPVE